MDNVICFVYNDISEPDYKLKNHELSKNLTFIYDFDIFL
jgi:hypothetical protein